MRKKKALLLKILAFFINISWYLSISITRIIITCTNKDCRNPKCSNVAKCSNYYILPRNCIDIYRQSVVIYYNMTTKCSTNIIRNVVTYYNMTRKCSTNSIPNVVTYYNMTHKCSTNIIPNWPNVVT